MPIDEPRLIQRCLRGDPIALRTLIERYQTDVFGLCMRLLGHRQDAEDVTQEVFMRVVRSLTTYDRSRPFRPWILSIAVNRCRTWIDQRGRRPELADYLHETVEDRCRDDAAELQAEIQQVLSVMRDDHREVFVLFHERGLPYEEIAEVVNRPVGTVKTWLHRARLEVLDHLKQRGMILDTVPHELP